MKTLPKWLAHVALLIPLFLIGQGSALNAQELLVQREQPQLFLVTNIPMAGTFWSAQLTNQPPLPFDPFAYYGFDLPVYAYDLANNIFVIDDREVDYVAFHLQVQAIIAEQRAIAKAARRGGQMSTMDLDGPPDPGGGGGGGDGGGDGGGQSYVLPPGLKITPPIITNGNVTVSIYEHNPAIPYDIYYTTNLNSPIVWNIAATGGIGQTNYTVLGVWGTATNAFFIAASAADVDGDGLKDGYEALVLKTNPFNADTDGDGMSDGWEIAHGLNPLVSDQPYTPPATTLTITKPTSSTQIQ
jgi:hypothetical protein